MIDPQHPIREMGREYLTAGDPHEERMLRALLNGSYTRRQDVAERDHQIQQLQGRLLEIESGQAAMQRWSTSPEYEQASERFFRLKDLEADGHVPEGTAEEYWRGAQVDAQRLQWEEYQGRYNAMQAENEGRNAAQFAQDAWGYASRLPAYITSLPGFGQWFNESLFSFNSELELGHYPQLQRGDIDALHHEFTRFFGSRLARESAAMQAHRQHQSAQVERTAAAKAAAATRTQTASNAAAVEQFKQNVADRRQQTPPHPLGQLASAARDRVPTEGQAVPEDTGQLSPHELKKQLRQESREAARRRFAQR
jgi:hypothetical protein